jgi:hypothetical protein
LWQLEINSARALISLTNRLKPQSHLFHFKISSLAHKPL